MRSFRPRGSVPGLVVHRPKPAYRISGPHPLNTSAVLPLRLRVAFFLAKLSPPIESVEFFSGGCCLNAQAQCTMEHVIRI
ncbi:hypothetical protein OPV22_019643 [Ensete ventricosum]|uniref:Uncharacterized protein n=1 Tax=Ensete ventricosum TaxID=4639 RepID=A0AAV8QC21_ENSVE|nr:hypothetical protein OPV22_019643 [Ensete ventricosum]